MLLRTSKNEQKVQLFLRAVTCGVLSERDRLLNYTIAEFYNEWSLFIIEQEKIKANIEAMKRKSK